jgi:hypothetical protein
VRNVHLDAPGSSHRAFSSSIQENVQRARAGHDETHELA